MKTLLIAVGFIFFYLAGLFTAAHSSRPEPTVQVESRPVTTPPLPYPVWIDLSMGYHEVGPAPLRDWAEVATFLLNGFSNLMLNSEKEKVTTITLRVARQAEPPEYVGAFTRWYWKVKQRGCFTDWEKPECVGLRPVRLNGGPAVGASAESDTDKRGWAP